MKKLINTKLETITPTEDYYSTEEIGEMEAARKLKIEEDSRPIDDETEV